MNTIPKQTAQWLTAILFAFLLTWIALDHTGPVEADNRIVVFSEFNGAVQCLLNRCPAIQGAFRLLLINGLGNIVVFFPLGFLLWSPLNNFTDRAIIIASLSGLVLSTGFEVAQLWIPGRVTALDDIILNTLGTWIGSYLKAQTALHKASRVNNT